MHEPDDFGLNAARTLSFSSEGVPPPGFVHFWSEWSRSVWSDEPSLHPFDPKETSRDPGAPGVTHLFRSRGDVRIGCRLSLPDSDSPPHAVVITTHGYAVERGEPLTDPTRWTERGLAVLQVRVRGFPGSQLDCGDLTAMEFGYLTVGLHNRETWIMNGAVADLVNAVRAARERFGGSTPIMLHGESFGGGLAVLAASQVSGRIDLSRIVLSLPSLGCWAWRMARRPHAGAGLDVWRFMDAYRGSEHTTPQILAMFDAAIHARRVHAPVICKLAERDDTVPAPTAAAVYNNLASDPGMKWRFITRYGHFDGGIADARRHAEFERRAADFLDPTTDPMSTPHRSP